MALCVKESKPLYPSKKKKKKHVKAEFSIARIKFCQAGGERPYIWYASIYIYEASHIPGLSTFFIELYTYISLCINDNNVKVHLGVIILYK